MRGVPLTLKCPKCMRGKYSYERQVRGCRATGVYEKHKTREKRRGRRHGPARYRGEVECGDCGHKWFSIHPSAAKKPDFMM